jgi:hypothetical protein
MKVTEASMLVLAERCTNLEVLDIAGTNVCLLPRKLDDLILVTDLCPMIKDKMRRSKFSLSLS